MSRWKPRPVLEPEASICAVVCPASWLFASSIVQMVSLSEGLGLRPGSYLFLCLIRAPTSRLNLICPYVRPGTYCPSSHLMAGPLPQAGWAAQTEGSNGPWGQR